MEIETRTVERKYVIIRDESFMAGRVLTFLEEIEDTDPAFPMRWRTKYDEIATALQKEGVVGTTTRGSWYEKDGERRAEMHEELRDALMRKT